jgi:hypothetical protein
MQCLLCVDTVHCAWGVLHSRQTHFKTVRRQGCGSISLRPHHDPQASYHGPGQLTWPPTLIPASSPPFRPSSRPRKTLWQRPSHTTPSLSPHLSPLQHVSVMIPTTAARVYKEGPIKEDIHCQSCYFLRLFLRYGWLPMHRIYIYII